MRRAKKERYEKINTLPISFCPPSKCDLICSVSSAVKELIENSVDSGATAIYVEITKTGLERIEVIDNGSGIYPLDMAKIGTPLSTSKVEPVPGRLVIDTLGFRGEALYRISELAKVTLISKTADYDTAYAYTVGGRKPVVTDLFDTYSENSTGTAVIVENLFGKQETVKKTKYSQEEDETEEIRAYLAEVLQRKKQYRFLAEENLRYTGSLISKSVLEQIMINPQIAFTYVAEGKTVYSTSGSGLEETITEIFGNEFFDTLMSVDWHYEGVKTTGYISKPRSAQKVDSLQFVSVNGRITKEPCVYESIYTATRRHFIDSYPFFALSITMPKRDVNPNVGTDKLTLDFANPTRVKNAIGVCVATTLTYHENSIVRSRMHNKIYEEDYPFEFFPAYLVTKKKGWFGEKRKNYGLEDELGIDGKEFHDNFGFLLDNNADSSILLDRKIESFGAITQKLLDKHQVDQSDFGKYVKLSDGVILGNVFSRYVAVERDDFVYIINYYNARSRFYYEYYIDTLAEYGCNEVSKPLKEPFVFKVDEIERAYFDKRVEEFRLCGFDFKPFSDIYYRLDSIPFPLGGVLDIAQFCRSIKLCSMCYGYYSKEISPEFLGMIASRYFILPQERMSAGEVKNFLKLLDGQRFVNSPCGRPIVVVYTRFDFDRRFARCDL